jgi:indolepyruvate ferredoxin oxidoreductase beta subunit
MLGAASPHLILEERILKEFIRTLFEPRGEKLVEMNLKAFYLGRSSAV